MLNKKIIILMVTLITVGGIGFWFVKSKKNTEYSNNSNTSENSNKELEKSNNNHTNNKKIGIIYFSATGNTEKVAEYIKDATDGDLIEIIPKNEYTADDLNYGNNNSRANKEQNDESARPEIKNDINTDNYDIIFLGYPIWWGDVPKIILTFLDSHNLDGKTVIPFCTSGSSSISNSLNTLHNYNNINWINGKRLSIIQSEVTNWVNGLNY